MGIKAKIFIYTVFIIAVLTSILGYLNLDFQKNMIYTQKIDDVKFFMDGFAIAIKESLISKDYTRIGSHIKELKYNDKINNINIYDENGVIIGSNNPHNLNQKTLASHIIKIYKVKKGIVYRKKREIILAEPIMVRNYMYGVLEVVLPSSIITDIESKYINTIMYFLILAFISGVIISYIIASSISRKVYALISASKALASGDFKQKIDINSNDEFGELGRIFNKMIFNMKIMFNVIKKINFSTPSDELLEVIMDNIIMALNAQRISILYYQQDQDVLKLNKVRGLEDDIVDSGFLRKGEGVAGKVFETGIPMIVNSGFESKEFKKFENTKWRDEKIKNIMCLPIIVEKDVVGVINVVNKNTPNGFDEFDLKLMQALMVHIASAISRSSMYNETITDGLTGLYIKKYFYSRLEEEAFRAKRYGQALSLMVIDIDDFKDMNKKFGTLECDIILMHLGRLIKNNIRLNIDIPARFGGDEIALILPETDMKKSMLFAERLRKKIEEFVFPRENGEISNITVSIGVAQYDPEKDLPQLIADVEEALKLSKSKGKNRVTFSERL